MKIRLVLADTGRLFGSTANLLNAGWTATTAIVLPEGGWTLPSQAVVVFLEADKEQLNRPYVLKLELLDDEGKLAQFARADDVTQEVRIVSSVVVQPVPGAPIGTPGGATILVDMALGTLRIPAPSRRYVWRASVEDIDEAKDEVGFWVNPPLQQPAVGVFAAASSASN